MGANEFYFSSINSISLSVEGNVIEEVYTILLEIIKIIIKKI